MRSRKSSSVEWSENDNFAQQEAEEKLNRKFYFKVSREDLVKNIEKSIDSKILLKNFFDAVSNKKDPEKYNKINSLTKMISSVAELEKDGILSDKEAGILVEFVVGKFVESRIDKAIDSLKMNKDFNWFIASSKKDIY
jgi:hypothetical protein